MSAQSEIVKKSQNWANRENENLFGPGWGKKLRPLPAPLHFSHRQPMKTQHSFQPTCATLQKLKPLKLCCWHTLYLCIVMQLYGHAQHKLKSTPSWEIDSVTPSWEKDSVKVIMRITTTTTTTILLLLSSRSIRSPVLLHNSPRLCRDPTISDSIGHFSDPTTQ